MGRGQLQSLPDAKTNGIARGVREGRRRARRAQAQVTAFKDMPILAQLVDALVEKTLKVVDPVLVGINARPVVGEVAAAEQPMDGVTAMWQ